MALSADFNVRCLSISVLPFVVDRTVGIVAYLILSNKRIVALVRLLFVRLGMVKLRIREAAAKAGITTAYGLQKAMDIPPGTAARLWRGKMTMISLNTIDGLCKALNCKPADLIVRVADK